MTDAKEQRYLDSFETLLIRIHNGLNSKLAESDSQLAHDSSAGPVSKVGSQSAGDLALARYSGYTPPGARLLHPSSSSGSGVNAGSGASAGAASRAGRSGLGTRLLEDDDYIRSTMTPGVQAVTMSRISGRSSINSGGAAGRFADLRASAMSSDLTTGMQPSDSNASPGLQDHEAFMLVDVMSLEEREQYIDAICTAIRHHVHFPPACSNLRSVEGKITFPRTYTLGILPSCSESYDFSDRNFAFKIPRIAFDTVSILVNSMKEDDTIETQAAQDAAATATARLSVTERGAAGSAAVLVDNVSTVSSPLAGARTWSASGS